MMEFWKVSKKIVYQLAVPFTLQVNSAQQTFISCQATLSYKYQNDISNIYEYTMFKLWDRYIETTDIDNDFHYNYWQ